MRTPKIYIDNLKKGVVTDDMISDVLFSYSKRAKNYRDRLRDIRNHIYYYGVRQYDDKTISFCEEKKDLYYSKKDEILHLYPEKIVCIHKQAIDRIQTFWQWDEECGGYDEYVNTDAVIDSGVSEQEDEDGYSYKEKWIKVKLKEYLYFVYYVFDGHSFHNPIEEKDLKDYQAFEVVNIDELVTEGEDVNILLSVQFCDKVWDLVKKTKGAKHE